MPGSKFGDPWNMVLWCHNGWISHNSESQEQLITEPWLIAHFYQNFPITVNTLLVILKVRNPLPYEELIALK